MLEMLHEFCRTSLLQPRLFTWLVVVMYEAPDAPASNVFVQLILLHHIAQVRTFLHPIAFLNDASIHIYDVERSVGSCRHVNGPEIWVGGTNEFRLFISVSEIGNSLVDIDLCPTDQSTNRFCKKQITT